MKPYYRKHGITIYHGDCRDVLPTLPKVDLVLTDPPYGIDFISRWGGPSFGKIRGDDKPNAQWLHLLNAPILYCFTRWDVLQVWREAIEATGLKVRDALVWDRISHGMADVRTCWAPTYDLILYASRKPEPLERPRPQNILRHWRVDAGATGKSSGRMMVHPSQKPEPLIAQIISKHASAGVILDPFMGSGTTLVAARNLKRHAIGIEIEEKYCEIAAKRLDAAAPAKIARRRIAA